MSLLVELLDVLDKTINGIYTNDANIESCREETLEVVNADLLMDKYYHNEKNNILSAIGKRPKEIHEKYLLKAQLSYLVREVAATYYEKAFFELKSSVVNGT